MGMMAKRTAQQVWEGTWGRKSAVDKQSETDPYLGKSGLNFHGHRETEDSSCEQSNWTLEMYVLSSVTRDEGSQAKSDLISEGAVATILIFFRLMVYFFLMIKKIILHLFAEYWKSSSCGHTQGSVGMPLANWWLENLMMMKSFQISRVLMSDREHFCHLNIHFYWRCYWLPVTTR